MTTPPPAITLAYLCLFAHHLVDGEETSDELYALWLKMTPDEQDLANHMVDKVFGRWVDLPESPPS